MNGVLSTLGRVIARRRRLILCTGLLATVVSGALGSGAMSALSLSRFEVPDSESRNVARVLDQRFDTGSANLVLLVTAKTGTVDDPAITSAGQELTRELSTQENVAEAKSYWSAGGTPALRGTDGRQALVLGRVPGSATEARAAIEKIAPAFTRDTAAVTVEVGGQDWVFRQVSQFSTQDFLRAELIVLPLVFLLLMVLYRRAALALATLGVGLFSMVVTLAGLRGLTVFTEVSTFAMNVTLIMGLTLGVDYCLFMVSRFREELDRGRDVPDAVAATVATAGRTVLFSGLTVATSLAMLLLFPFPFLRSFGYAGVFVVAASVTGALVILPAILAVLGRRAARGKPGRAGISGRWARIAELVMRRPVITGGAALTVLLILAAPVLGLRIGLPDDRVLPASASSRQVQDDIRANFGQEETDAIHLVAADWRGDRSAAIAGYAARLSAVDGVAQVDSAAGSFAGGRLVLPAGGRKMIDDAGSWWSAIPTQAALGGDVPGLIDRLRAVPPPATVDVGGYPADLTDFRDALTSRLPLVLGLIVLTTFAILFLMTGSILVPIKATVLNMLSLAVMFGVVVWGFQDGNLASLLGFTPIGRLEPSIPILMFCIVYGLSMDYEVFMVSRIVEEHERGADLRTAVTTGIQRSAPLISAAAAILALGFAAYAGARVSLLQMMAVGTALAVVVDATLIRAVLMPALMRLAGAANWWAPPPLRALHTRFGIREEVPAAR
jgi:RND superfamily putative drug exporter